MLRSLQANVLLALGGNQTATFASLLLASREAGLRSAFNNFLKPAGMGFHLLDDVARSAGCDSVGNDVYGATFDATSSHGTEDTEPLELADVLGRRGCLSLIAAHEHSVGTRFDSVLLLPADHLFVLPLWPHCFHSLSRSRRSGRVWWLTRAAAESAFASHARKLARASQRCGSGAINGSLALDDGLRIGVRLSIPRAAVSGSRARPATSSLPILSPTSSSSSSALTSPDCLAWRATLRSIHRRRLASTIVQPPCPPNFSLASLTTGTSHSKQGGVVETVEDTSADTAVAFTAQLVCGGEGLTPPPRIALCLGGLARSFGRPLVYRALRGHVLLPLGAASTSVFAHLRLGDVRGMTGRFGKDFSATIASTRDEALRALHYLGAKSEDIIVAESSAVTRPNCAGHGGMYDRRANEQQEPPETNSTSHTPRPAKSCDNYGLPCSQHTIDGMRPHARPVRPHHRWLSHRHPVFLCGRPRFSCSMPRSLTSGLTSGSVAHALQVCSYRAQRCSGW